MSFEFLGGAAWNVLTVDAPIYEVASGTGVITSERLIRNYDTDTFHILQDAFTKQYREIIIEDFSAEDWSGSVGGDQSYVVRFATSATIQSIMIRVEKVDGSDYNLGLATTDAFGADVEEDIGSTALQWGHANKYDLRIVQDNDSGDITLEVVAAGGSWSGVEASITTVLPVSRVQLEPEDQSDSSAEVGYGRVSIGHYDAPVERKGIPITAWRVAVGVGVTSSSEDNPSVITTAANHGFSNGDSVLIAGHITAVPDINGVHTISSVTATTFTIPVNVTTAGTGGTVILDPTYAEYDVDGGPTGTRVDEWDVPVAMGSDIDSDSLANEQTSRQTYKIGIGGIPSAYTVIGQVGVISLSFQRVNVAAKSGTFFNLFTDGSNDIDVGTGSPFAENDTAVRGVTNTAPDGGSWTTDDFGLLEIGVRATNGTDGALNAEVNVCAIEIYDFPDDPAGAVLNQDYEPFVRQPVEVVAY